MLLGGTLHISLFNPSLIICIVIGVIYINVVFLGNVL